MPILDSTILRFISFTPPTFLPPCEGTRGLGFWAHLQALQPNLLTSEWTLMGTPNREPWENSGILIWYTTGLRLRNLH